MKTKILTGLVSCLFCFTGAAQINQRFDNSNYKAIYFREACDLIAKTPDIVLLDVRSPGEFADTNKDISINLGRLKGAINISIDSIEKHTSELEALKNKTFLVYCSHSQRSRIVSKALADDGFTKVYSLNGGMTEVDRTPDADFPCKRSLFTTSMPYRLIGPKEAIEFLKEKNHIVLDVRPPAGFNGTDTAEYANVGCIQGAINVPLSMLDQEIPRLIKFKDRAILLYDLNSDEAMKGALKLSKAGFKHLLVLYDGFAAFLVNTGSSSADRKELTTGLPAYKIIGVRETVDLVNKNPGLVVADMRPAMEFKNMSSNNYSNLGHIKNAINFTADSLEMYLKGKPKSTPVLLYGAFTASMKMRGMTGVDVSSTCKKLTADGYTSIYLLYDGLYSVVWASGNVESCRDAKTILTDHQNLY